MTKLEDVILLADMRDVCNQEFEEDRVSGSVESIYQHSSKQHSPQGMPPYDPFVAALHQSTCRKLNVSSHRSVGEHG
jgi:hypothetical protein